MAIPLCYLRHVSGTLILECDCDVNYLNIAWSQVQALNSASRNVRTTDIIIWNNKNIKIAGKSVYFRDWHQVGIETIKDLLKEKNEFLLYHSFSSFVSYVLMSIIDKLDHLVPWIYPYAACQQDSALLPTEEQNSGTL